MALNNTNTLTSLFSYEVAEALAVFVGNRNIIPFVANAASGIATSVAKSIDTEVSTKINNEVINNSAYPVGLYNSLNTTSNNVSRIDLNNSFPNILNDNTKTNITGSAISKLYAEIVQNYPGGVPANINIQSLTNLLSPIISVGVNLSLENAVAAQVTDMFSRFIEPDSAFMGFDFGSLPTLTLPDIDNPSFPSIEDELEEIISDIGDAFDSVLIGDDGPPVTPDPEEEVNDFEIADMSYDEVDYVAASLSLQNQITQSVKSEYDYMNAVDDQFDKVTDQIQQLALGNAVNECKRFDTFSDSNTEKLRVNQFGFTDPDAVYPSTDYQGQPETNRLARGVIAQTIVQEKFDNRLVGAPLPNGSSFSEPISTYKAKYPYNSVTETMSGHVIEVDDTPGGERLHIYHRTGSYYEIDAVGNVYHRSKGSEYVIIDKNGYLTVAGDYNLSVSGNMNVRICDNANIEVDGDAIINGYNNVEVNAAGRLRITGGEAIDMRAPNIFIQADNTLHITADDNVRFKVGTWDEIVTGSKSTYVVGDTSEYYGGKTNLTFKGSQTNRYSDDRFTQIGGDVEFNIAGKVLGKIGEKFELDVKKDVNFIAHEKLSVKTSKDIMFQTDETFSVKSGESILFDAADFYKFDSGSSPDANDEIDDLKKVEVGKSPSAARYSVAGLITSRRDVIRNPIPDTFGDNFVDTSTYTTDDAPETATEVNKGLVERGYIENKELSDTPVKNETDDKPRAVTVSPVEVNTELKALAEVPPDNFQLSPHFTLGMLSSKAPAQPHKVKAQLGLSIGDIVSNLQDVALNVLEPLYAIYPNILVTSGFRRVEESKNSGSVHPYGLAVDIQLKGVSDNEYYSIAQRMKSLVPNFDQFILEYKSTGSKKPWIHIGVKNKTGAQRVSTMTFFNHAKHSDGFVNLVT